MDCKKVKDDLFLLYTQGEPGRNLIVAIRQYARDCPHCARKAEHVKRIVTIVRQGCGRSRAPSDLRQRILEGLRRQT